MPPFQPTGDANNASSIATLDPVLPFRVDLTVAYPSATGTGSVVYAVVGDIGGDYILFSASTNDVIPAEGSVNLSITCIIDGIEDDYYSIRIHWAFNASKHLILDWDGSQFTLSLDTTAYDSIMPARALSTPPVSVNLQMQGDAAALSLAATRIRVTQPPA